MRMVLGIATRKWDGWAYCVRNWQENTMLGWLPYSIVFDKDVVPAFQQIYEETDEEIICLMHDDLTNLEFGWDVRVLQAFSDPMVGVVGFGGALGHGTHNLYQVPYHLPNLARQDFMSNMKDAEVHGRRFTGERDVAILDGFALFVRRSVLDTIGGWPVNQPVGYFMYSEWLCCEARRQGYRIRLAGVACEHLGGKSSGYISQNENYERAHRHFYEMNRDVMPYRVPE